MSDTPSLEVLAETWRNAAERAEARALTTPGQASRVTLQAIASTYRTCADMAVPYRPPVDMREVLAALEAGVLEGDDARAWVTVAWTADEAEAHLDPNLGDTALAELRVPSGWSAL